MRFAPVLTHCVGNVRDQLQTELVSQICQDHPLIEGDPQILRTMMDEMVDDLGDELTRLYQALRVQTPNVLIVQAGYPLVIDPEATDCYGLHEAELEWFEETNRAANDRIREIVELEGGIYVDVEEAFLGHGACGDDPWIRGLSLWGRDLPGPLPDHPGDLAEHSFHPTAEGHIAYSAAINDAIRRHVPHTGE